MFERIKILFIALAQLLGLITAVVSTITLFNQLHRYLELLSNFRMQYFFASIACLLPLLLLKSYKSAALMAVIVILNTAYILPWYFSPETAANDQIQIKLMHSNVYTPNNNYQKLIDIVLEENPDILILQEVNQLWLDNLQTLEPHYPYQFAVPRQDNFGIAVLSKYPFDTIEEIYWGIIHVPSLRFDITVSGFQFTTLATHPLPPSTPSNSLARNAQLNEVVEIASGIQTPLVVIGDLNVSMWSNNYRPFEEVAQLTNTRQGQGILPTWPVMLPIAMIPIDHCLVSSHFTVQEMKVSREMGSDHLPIMVTLGID
ncbi:MAG: endonuclease/exonuclease/phosphatase family protein [Anaerolineales bacterium]|nr:endonuclease/exonuclease/phosphatase family protein [Anaerolineales bacterium]